ncbi:MAG: bifunctional phosphopantothenoylcysteine decarboxylase/phosphopantothenate--cysteine ligase CoaBC [Flavobacteriales bacterium]|nr:bifunctional phosphopantothenoylcysteine decarboxylase/phosphopantothenate--cysteine ligase CoaBC [Flavobacteriales bacterium]
MLRGKKILLGVTGGIAAYKSALLVRELIKKGALVKVIMTKGASDFITPLTLSVLSKNPVFIDFFNPQTGEWNNHVDLGIWADAFIIAPATANTLGKMANGISDNLLLATYLSARCPVFVAPAMDLDMYKHESVIQNLQTLKNRSVHIIPAESGELASGLEGEGRMAEPENIIRFIENFLSQNLPLAGKKALITAGPTYEPLDPVRFIGNRSSGLMGIEIANRFADLGAAVTLVLGPTHLRASDTVETIRVETADEMAEKAIQKAPNSDFIVCAAAVADYKPENPQKEKIKKTGEKLSVNLVKNPDILAYLGLHKTAKQIVVGFALETEQEEKNAQDKLSRKNADIIILNSLRDEGSGFMSPTNKITIFDRLGNRVEFMQKPKNKVAEDIVNAATELYSKLTS